MTDALNLAVDVLITVLFVSMMLGLAYIGIAGNNATSESLQYYYNKDIYADYNGSVIDGSAAVSLAKSLSKQGNVLVKIYTKAYPDGFISTEGITDIKSDKYIDPSNDYICNTIKDTTDRTIAIQVIEIGTNLYSSTEENLVNEIARLDKGYNILSERQRAIGVEITAAETEDTSNVTIDTGIMSAYKEFVYYNKLQEFYKKWRDSL